MSNIIDSEKLAEIWSSASPYTPTLTLPQQSFYAAVLIILGLVSTGLFIVTPKKKASIQQTLSTFVIGWIASLCFGFGSVFLIDSVGVYS